jgi:peptidoglycan lytic transglycosylase
VVQALSKAGLTERGTRRPSCRAVLLAASLALAGAGLLPAPPARAATSAAGADERAVLRDLVTAAKRDEWSKANALARKVKDPLAPVFAEWLFLTDDSTTPSFDELSQFLAGHPAWPYRGALLTKAEQAIPLDMRAREIVDWFGDREPRTGDGALRLGEAKIALGARAEGEAIIKRGWSEMDFTPDAERRAVAEHGAILQGAPTAQRIARLLWQRRTSEASRILDGADSDTRQLAKARMTLIQKPQQMSSVVAGLPGALRNDTGILYEQARASRLNGDIRNALPFAMKAGASAASRWWPERHALAREALQLGLYQEAYRVTADHGLSAGADFADAEWLAGWIALRFLDKPAVAAEHFMTLFKNVSYAVSRSRGAYWAARAYEAAGKLADAATYYETAAAYETTYYGQLAAARLEQSRATVALPAPARMPEKHDFASSELVHAARLASAVGSDAIARPFFLALAAMAEAPADYAYIGKLALDHGFDGIAVRIGKKAIQENIVLTDIAYPLVSLPQAGGGGPEPALVLGITRQESEFDETAESPSGARGLMQLMPATAKIVAKQAHLAYSAAKLDDGSYNMRLGIAYLGDLIDRFGGSYALAVAAYNAGPTNARRWIEDFGDPRDPNVDPIDWVEKIPFAETRNYVQRVLENTQVYRSRLAKRPAPIKIAEDLARPNSTKPFGADLTAYLGRGGGGTLIARAEEEKKPPRAEKPEPVKAPDETDKSAARPEPKPAEITPAVTAPAPAEPPKPVELADAAPLAAAPPPLPPAPTALAAPPSRVLAPQPKPDIPKSAQKPKSRPARTAAAKPDRPSPAKESPAAAAPETVANEPPAVNPFGNGQPETTGVSSKCTRMILDLSGKPRCADRQAMNE